MFTVLESSLAAKSKLTNDQIKKIESRCPVKIDPDNGMVSFKKYHQFRKDNLETILAEMGEISNFNGELLIGSVEKEGRYKYTKKNPHFENCQLKTTAKKKTSEEGEKKKRLTTEEKTELLLDFIEKNKKLPDSKDEIEGFKVGTFLSTILKWNDVYKSIEDYLEDYLPN